MARRSGSTPPIGTDPLPAAGTRIALFNITTGEKIANSEAVYLGTDGTGNSVNMRVDVEGRTGLTDPWNIPTARNIELADGSGGLIARSRFGNA